MSAAVNSTTYVIVPELRTLINWLVDDAAKRSAKARVVFLGGLVYGTETKIIMDEVFRVLDELPGSAIIMNPEDVGLFDFLEGNLTRAPTMRWMARRGRDVVTSFGVGPGVRRSNEIRRIVGKVSPPLLNVLRQGKEYEVEGDFCFIEGWSWPNPELIDRDTDAHAFADDTLTTWYKAVKKIVVHDRSPSNDCYPEVDDWSIALGGFPAQTVRVHLFAIDDGKASRFAFASRAHGKAAVTVAVKPAEMFRKAPLGAARFA